MSLEDLSNYWNMIFIASLGFVLHKFVNHSGRISTLETNQKNNLGKLQKIDELCNYVSYIKGLLDEHMKKKLFFVILDGITNKDKKQNH